MRLKKVGRWPLVLSLLALTLGVFLLPPVREVAYAQFTTAQMYALGKFGWNGTSVSVSTPMLAPDGTAAAPAYGFSSIAGVGMYRTASSRLNFSTVATGRWQIDGNGFFIPLQDDNYDIGAAGAMIRNLTLSRSIQGSKTKTLTESAATNFVQISIADGGHVGGRVHYDLWCADAVPNYVARSCTAEFACINKADAEVCNIQTPACSGDASNGANTFSANTLDYVAGTNAIILRELATCSLTQTVLEIHYRLDFDETLIVTPQ